MQALVIIQIVAAGLFVLFASLLIVYRAKKVLDREWLIVAFAICLVIWSGMFTIATVLLRESPVDLVAPIDPALKQLKLKTKWKPTLKCVD